MPSATYRAADFLQAARKLGVEVVVAVDRPNALEKVMGARALEVPLEDASKAAATIVALDDALALDAIVAVDDQGTVVAATAAQALGLRHNAPEAVTAARDKLAMRTLLSRAEVTQPAFAELAPGASSTEIAEAVEQVGLPCVVKPTTLSASQGVLRADTYEETVEAVARVRRIADRAGVPQSAPLLVEQFVGGPEVAVEGLLTDGTLEVLAIFDKPEPLDGPAFEETIYVTPSRLDDAAVQAVVSSTRAAASALGLRQGPVHAELRVHGARATVIEIAARTIGGLCSRSLTFSTGRSLEEIVISNALGVSVGPLSREERASGVLMIPIPAAGVFEGVQGTEAALAVPGVVDVQITATRGRYLEPVPEGNRYLGFVFARSAKVSNVEGALRRAKSLLHVRVGSR
jgi:biotin carboxylase